MPLQLSPPLINPPHPRSLSQTRLGNTGVGEFQTRLKKNPTTCGFAFHCYHCCTACSAPTDCCLHPYRRKHFHDGLSNSQCIYAHFTPVAISSRVSIDFNRAMPLDPQYQGLHLVTTALETTKEDSLQEIKHSQALLLLPHKLFMASVHPLSPAAHSSPWPD